MRRRDFIGLSSIGLIGLASSPLWATTEGKKSSTRFRLPLRFDKITEGWIYEAELKYHPDIKEHKGIDFAAARNTPVYAVADGYAVSSFHTAYLPNLYLDQVTGKSHRLGFGIGRFVQIYHPEMKAYSAYCHLERINEEIVPFVKPNRNKQGLWSPDIIYEPLNVVLGTCREIKQGDLIGWVGDSGLSQDYEENFDTERDPLVQRSWDETHLHFEGPYERNDQGLKSNRRDPYNYNAVASAYGKGNRQAKGGFWETNFFGYIKHAA